MKKMGVIVSNLFLWGLVNCSVLSLMAVCLVLTHITIISVTVFLHRHQAHRSLELAPSVSHFFRFWLWLTTGMVTKEWVAVHRKHHAKVETEHDPHSPIHFGIHNILWAGVRPYRSSAKCSEVLEKYGQGTPNDLIENRLYTPYHFLGIILMLCIDLGLFGLVGGTIVWAVQMVWIPFFAAGVINGLGHYFGYRNFEPPDASTNIIPWGILIGGEELHNNHHTYSDSAKLSVKWFEFDLGYVYIKMLCCLGLAKIKRTIPLMPSDADTEHQILTLITKCKMNIIDRYRKEVIYHLVHNSVPKDLFSRHRISRHQLSRWLHRESNFLAKYKLTKLEKILKTQPILNTIYLHRKQLSKLMHNNKIKKSELLLSIQDWCRQARKTEIKQLEEYSQWLHELISLNSQRL